MSIAPVPREGRFYSIAEAVALRQKFPNEMENHRKYLREYEIYAKNGYPKYMSWYASTLMDDGRVEESIAWFMTALRYKSEVATDILDREISRLGVFYGREVWEHDIRMVLGLLRKASNGDLEAQYYVWESICRLGADKSGVILVRDINNVVIFGSYLSFKERFQSEEEYFEGGNGCFELSSFAPLSSANFLSIFDKIATVRDSPYPVTNAAKEALHYFQQDKEKAKIKAQKDFEQNIFEDKEQVATLSNQYKVCCICNRRIGSPRFSKLYEMCSPKRTGGDEQKFEVLRVWVPRCEICAAEEARKESKRKMRDEEIEVQISRFERNWRCGCVGVVVMLVLCVFAWFCNWVFGIITSIILIPLLTYIIKAKKPERHVYPAEIKAYDEHLDWRYPPIKYLMDKGYAFGKRPPEMRF